jgi:hypothetical protein
MKATSRVPWFVGGFAPPLPAVGPSAISRASSFRSRAFPSPRVGEDPSRRVREMCQQRAASAVAILDEGTGRRRSVLQTDPVSRPRTVASGCVLNNMPFG